MREIPKEDKVFSSDREIDSAIIKIKRRIEDLKNLQNSFDSEKITVVERKVKDTMREIFGVNSFQFERYEHFQIWSGSMYINMQDSYIAQCERDGIPKALTLLEGEVEMLEEKKEDFSESISTENQVEEAMYKILEACSRSDWEFYWIKPTMDGPGGIKVNNKLMGQTVTDVKCHIEAAERMLNERNWIRHKDGIWYKATKEGREALENRNQPKVTVMDISTEFAKKIFIVHGHDEASKYAVAHLINQVGLEPLILHEQPNSGKTIIEKLEHHSNVGFAVVLLTADDMGYAAKQPEHVKPRARQNVIMELGFFMGKISRGKVCALHAENVEIPSDFQGVLYVPMDSAGAWKFRLGKEIKAAGFDIDISKIT